MARFLAFFTLFHLSITFFRLEVPFKQTIRLMMHASLQTTMVVISSFFTDQMNSIFSHYPGPCKTSLKSQFYNDKFRMRS